MELGGQFTQVGATARHGIAQVAVSDGTLAAWDPSLGLGGANALRATSGGIAVGGDFPKVGGASLPNLATVAASGTGAPNTSWNPAPDGGVLSLGGDAARL